MNLVSGVRCQVSSVRKGRRNSVPSYETTSELRRVGHRADHIPAGTVARPILPKFLFRFDWPLFRPTAGLNTDT